MAPSALVKNVVLHLVVGQTLGLDCQVEFRSGIGQSLNTCTHCTKSLSLWHIQI